MSPISSTSQNVFPCAETATDVVLVIHGGAGTILRENLTPDREQIYTEGIVAALKAGYEKIIAGASATDAVEAAVRELEDNPIFNAGRGAVFSADGRNEMDAAIMEGATGKAGAVAGVTKIRNPISLARAVMERTPFVLLSGPGAERLAEELQLPMVDPPYFWTETRWKQLLNQQEQEQESTDKDTRFVVSLSEDNKFGTVGAVAVDTNRHVSAATSTGGMTNKRYGRIGDSPIIGAGTWASDDTCAISATGHGEYFIRLAVAHDIAARMKYAGNSLAEAALAVVHGELKETGGEGGVIAIDRNGNAALPLNTPGMYRGYVTRDGKLHTAIYAD